MEQREKSIYIVEVKLSFPVPIAKTFVCGRLADVDAYARDCLSATLRDFKPVEGDKDAIELHRLFTHVRVTESSFWRPK